MRGAWAPVTCPCSLVTWVDGSAPRRPGIPGDPPGVVLVEEVVGIVEVVAAIGRGLDPEQVLGVAQVGLQLVGHVVVAEQVGEGIPVGVDDRIVLVHHVERDRAVVGVDRGLHRVAHVVEAVVQAARRRQLVGVGHLRVRVAGRRRVQVDHPLDPPVDQHRVRVGVGIEERRQLRHPLDHVPHVDDPGVVGHEVGDQRVEVAEAQRERRPAHQRVGLDAVVALVRRGLGLALLVLEVDLVAVGVDHDVAVEVLAEVDPGPGCSSARPSRLAVWGMSPSTNSGSLPSAAFDGAITTPYPCV